MVSKRIEQKLIDRTTRVKDAIALKEPDRVPLTPFSDQFFGANQAGLKYSDVLYKSFKTAKAYLKIFSRYDFDLYPAFFTAQHGKLNDLYDHRLTKWPGAANPDHRLSENKPFQYIERSWMEPSEYEELNTDITGFMLRKLLPRQNPSLSGFSKLPYASLMSYFAPFLMTFFFMDKEVQQTLRKFSPLKIIPKMMGLVLGQKMYGEKMEKRGNPVAFMNGAGLAPFDLISDTIRGMRGTMLDMIRNPEELKKACDIIANYSIKGLGTLDAALGTMGKYSVQTSFMPLHRGADGFMSNEQFETFYWPSLTKIIDAMIEKGYTPMPFFEGSYDQRLPYLADLAKKHPGKMIYFFQDTNIKKVKEMMGDHVCIRGNIPASLLIGGTTQQVEDYVKQSIEDCAEGGGFLVDGAISGIPNQARHENVVAMTKAVHKYGVYRK